MLQLYYILFAARKSLYFEVSKSDAHVDHDLCFSGFPKNNVLPLKFENLSLEPVSMAINMGRFQYYVLVEAFVNSLYFLMLELNL